MGLRDWLIDVGNAIIEQDALSNPVAILVPESQRPANISQEGRSLPLGISVERLDPDNPAHAPLIEEFERSARKEATP